MDEQMSAATKRKPRRRWLGAASLVAAGLVAGGILAGSQIAGAQGATSGNQAAATHQGRPAGNPATMTHGPGETLLTGDAAAKVTAAAKKEVPGVHGHPGRDRLGRRGLRSAHAEGRRDVRHGEVRQVLQRDGHGGRVRRTRTRRRALPLIHAGGLGQPPGPPHAHGHVGHGPTRLRPLM